MTPAVLRYPKKPFVFIGALEAAGAMLGLYAAGQLFYIGLFFFLAACCTGPPLLLLL